MTEPAKARNKPVHVRATGPEQVRELLESLRAAFPDARFSLANRVRDGKGDLAFVWSGRGTHSGEVGDVPPTDAPATVVVVSSITQRKGKQGS